MSGRPVIAPHWARVRGFASRLRGCDSGLAFVEFALSLPILLSLGLCGLEAANLAMAHLRVSNIAMLTADNAARVRDSIDESNVIELFTGGKMTGDTIDFRQNGRIVLSSIEVNAGGTGQWIRWQRCDGVLNAPSEIGAQDFGAANNALQSVGTGSNTISAAAGTAVIVAEVTYQYQPVVSEAIFGPRTIRAQAAFNVRQRTNQALTNTSNLTAAQIRTCNWRQP